MDRVAVYSTFKVRLRAIEAVERGVSKWEIGICCSMGGSLTVTL